MKNIALYCADPKRIREAEKLAADLKLNLLTSPPLPADTLALTGRRLELRRSGESEPIFVDFANPKLLYRLKHISIKKEAIARAVGLKKMKTPPVLDATAGLGRDSFILAALGCRVIMVERSPIIAALLADGLLRAAATARIASICRRMTLYQADSRFFSLPPDFRPGVIYLDPMYPARSKSAMVKKEMRCLRDIAGDDPDSGALLDWALARKVNRVAVKRPKGAKNLADRQPSFVIKSRKHRFDVYLAVHQTAMDDNLKALEF